MFDQFLRSQGLDFSNQSGDEEFITQLSTALRKHRSDPILVHGLRVQTMFAYVAAALGGCRIIVEEDAGEFFTALSELKRPDFRILTHEGKEFFVEVKNFNQSDPTEPYVLERDYAHHLRDYAAAFQKPLLFAIYWRRWRIWTLTPLDGFLAEGRGYVLSVAGAAQTDQKAILGDCLVGISKPLVLRFYSDPTKPRRIDPDGHAQFTIAGVSFVAAGREIVDELEKRLAWFFLRYGRWDDIEQPACVEDGELISFDIQGVRKDPNPDQDFLLIGQLSEMISQQFNSLTVEEEKVLSLSPEVDPEKLGVVIPKDFKGDALGIWRFTVRPAHPVFDQCPDPRTRQPLLARPGSNAIRR